MKTLIDYTILTFALAGILTAEPIAKGDQLSITVAGASIPKPEIAKINNVYPVGKKGTINIPFIGSYRAVGVEPAILALQLAKAYKDANIYENPKFKVVIKKDLEKEK